MRIDTYLWFARITKTRSQAATLAKSGHLRIDGRRIDRAHASITPGQHLTFVQNDRVRVLTIIELPARRGPSSEARACYSELGVDDAPVQT